MDTDALFDNCNSTLPLAKAKADKITEAFSDREWYVVKHGGKFWTVQDSFFVNHPSAIKIYRGQNQEEKSHDETARFLPLADGVGKEVAS